eukprot:363496-Chlamydomonas_euryale.AAC.3
MSGTATATHVHAAPRLVGLASACVQGAWQQLHPHLPSPARRRLGCALAESARPYDLARRRLERRRLDISASCFHRNFCRAATAERGVGLERGAARRPQCALLTRAVLRVRSSGVARALQQRRLGRPQTRRRAAATVTGV